MPERSQRNRKEFAKQIAKTSNRSPRKEITSAPEKSHRNLQETLDKNSSAASEEPLRRLFSDHLREVCKVFENIGKERSCRTNIPTEVADQSKKYETAGRILDLRYRPSIVCDPQSVHIVPLLWLGRSALVLTVSVQLHPQ